MQLFLSKDRENFFNAKIQEPALKKEDKAISFASTHYTNFHSKIISNTANLLLNNVITNWKKYSTNVKLYVL